MCAEQDVFLFRKHQNYLVSDIYGYFQSKEKFLFVSFVQVKSDSFELPTSRARCCWCQQTIFFLFLSIKIGFNVNRWLMASMSCAPQQVCVPVCVREKECVSDRRQQCRLRMFAQTKHGNKKCVANLIDNFKAINIQPQIQFFLLPETSVCRREKKRPRSRYSFFYNEFPLNSRICPHCHRAAKQCLQ